MRRLHEIDLANTAARPIAERHDLLWGVNIKAPKVNYRPARRREPDVFNALGDLLGEPRDADVEMIKQRIRTDPYTRNAATEQANIEIVECLHDWAMKNHIRARRYPIAPFVLSGAAGINLVYWSQLVLIKDGKAHVFFTDTRRQNGLTSEGRHFAFSMMHHRARAVYPDLEDAELAVFQFPMSEDDDKRRSLVDHYASVVQEPLYTYDELEDRVRETYIIWRAVLVQRNEEMRRRADRGRSDFGLTG